MHQGCFFLSSISCAFNQLRLMVTVVITCICGIHQVRKLVFDNYQTCSVPLSTENKPCKTKFYLPKQGYQPSCYVTMYTLSMVSRSFPLSRQLKSNIFLLKQLHEIGRISWKVQKGNWGFIYCLEKWDLHGRQFCWQCWFCHNFSLEQAWNEVKVRSGRKVVKRELKDRGHLWLLLKIIIRI